jgi:hypothetical protein
MAGPARDHYGGRMAMPPTLRRLLQEPWSARAWRATGHLTVGLPLGLATTVGLLVIAGLTLASATLFGPSVVAVLVPGMDSWPFLLPWTLILVLPLFLLLLWSTVPATAVQRWRFAALLGCGYRVCHRLGTCSASCRDRPPGGSSPITCSPGSSARSSSPSSRRCGWASASST